LAYASGSWENDAQPGEPDLVALLSRLLLLERRLGIRQHHHDLSAEQRCVAAERVAARGADA